MHVLLCGESMSVLVFSLFRVDLAFPFASVRRPIPIFSYCRPPSTASSGGLITPNELRLALESMEAQHESIEAQAVVQLAMVASLVAAKSSLDVKFVSLQMETGTGAQLLDQIKSQMQVLATSKDKVAVTAEDAVNLLQQLGLQINALEMSMAPKGSLDGE